MISWLDLAAEKNTRKNMIYKKALLHKKAVDDGLVNAVKVLAFKSKSDDNRKNWSPKKGRLVNGHFAEFADV